MRARVISARTRATIYRYLAAFGGFLVLGILAQPQAATLTDLWHAGSVALPFAIEKFMATQANANAAAVALPPRGAPAKPAAR